MSNGNLRVGRVLRAGTRGFAIGCAVMQPDIPAFGSFVRADGLRPGSAIYGLIYDVRVDDDPFVRQLIAAGELDEEYVEDQRQRRQVPVEVNVLVIGGRDASGVVYQRLPPQPPATLSWVEVCSPAEIRQFGRHLDFLGTVLNAADVPVDELLAASLRVVAAVQGDTAQSQAYLTESGRQLARLLSRDPARLDAILRRMRL